LDSNSSPISKMATNSQLFNIGVLILQINGMLAQTVPPDVFYVAGSTQKIEQLVGDYDRHFQRNTQNITDTEYNLWGTDLGVPFWHNDKTYVLFGDVPGTDGDPIAYTTDTVADDGIALTFIADSTGAYQPIDIPGISQGAFEVPMEGVSVDGNMYVYHTTDVMNRSVLAKSEDNGISFDLIVDTLSIQHFINVSIVKVDFSRWPRFAGDSGRGLVMFGSGDYRASDVRLAIQPTDGIEMKESILYFIGLDSDQNPIWSSKETEAVALFDQPCVGELSVTYNHFIKKWIMLYNCDNPRGIKFRTADQPWGPWSFPQVLFEPWIDEGYCNFIHVDWNSSNCDDVHDPGRENVWGGEYGPYQFEKLATGDSTSTTIYYSMSTWNPYTVVLMKSTLVKSAITGMNNVWQQRTKINCFPNPTSHYLTIEFFDQNDPKTIVIYNTTGQIIGQFSSIIDRLTLDTKRWKSGIYIVKIVNKQGQTSIKRIVRK